jgi:hypothetical protein
VIRVDACAHEQGCKATGRGRDPVCSSGSSPNRQGFEPRKRNDNPRSSKKRPAGQMWGATAGRGRGIHDETGFIGD